MIRYFFILFLGLNTTAVFGTSGNNILILLSTSQVTGGGLTYKLHHYKALRDAGEKAHIMLIDCDHIAQECRTRHLPYERCTSATAVKKIIHLCKKQHITLLHIHSDSETPLARAVKQHIPTIKVVRTLHGRDIFSLQALYGIDGVIAVNANTAHELEEHNMRKRMGIKQILHLPTFFNATGFEQFNTNESRPAFFSRVFGLTIDSTVPVITSIAQFYNDKYKNHKVLIRAAAQLIHDRHCNVHVMLAGYGPKKAAAMRLANALGVDRYVHFLGNVATEHIPALLWHSDINALTSNEEGAPCALVEGAMLKKPLIGTRGTGMEFVVKDKETGLLFEKNNVTSLANQLEILLGNAALRHLYGQAAYAFTKQYLVPEVLIKKYCAFLRML
ncbi:glycosyltransferase family 4 protein [Candidatus Dependentiae bacterium]|nr:glycosyltransferase family 4 protein [Candidatus Dependentiae bacterium]